MAIELTSDEEAEAAPSAPTDEDEAAALWEQLGAAWREGREEDEAGNPSEAEKAKSEYERVDDALNEAIRRSSWWEATQYDGQNLEKAPGIWTRDDEVPEAVRDLLERVVQETDWDWSQFDSLTHGQAQDLEEMLTETLTQPQGWSISSIAADLQSEFGMDEETAVGVAGDTSHGILNTSKEAAYESMEGSEAFEYDWVGPTDHRTTPTCRDIEAEIEARGGSVSKPTLKAILREKALEYEGTSEGGGTPGRVDEWIPHYGCRRTFVRTNAQVPSP